MWAVYLACILLALLAGGPLAALIVVLFVIAIEAVL